MANQTFIEFRDSGCHVYQWSGSRNAFTLKTSLDVPFEVQIPIEEIAAGPGVEAPSASNAIEAGRLSEARKNEINAQTLRQALKTNGIKIESAVAMIPKHWATLRVVTLPATNVEELHEMARFEAERHIPFNIERHIIAHQAISMDDIEGSRALIAAVDEPPSKQITNVFEVLGVRLEGVVVSSIALINTLLHSGKWDSEKDETVTFVNIGHSNTDILILSKGEPIFARSTSVGANMLPEALAEVMAVTPPEPPLPLEQDETPAGFTDLDAPLSPAGPYPTPGDIAFSTPQSLPSSPDPIQFRSVRLIREIRRTLDYAQREFECGRIARLFVSGAGANTPGLDIVLEKSFNAPMELLDPFEPPVSGQSQIRCTRKDNTEDSPLAFSLVVGALLGEKDEKRFRINLIPPSYLALHRSAKRRRNLMILTSLVLLFLVGGVLSAKQKLAEKKDLLTEMKTRAERDSKRVKEIQDKATVVKILRKNSSDLGSAIAILNDISKWKDLFQPGNMRISIDDFKYDYEKRRVTIFAYARSIPDHGDFLERLDKLDHFSMVIPGERQKKRAPNMSEDTEYFSVRCTIKEDTVQ